jgi:hypothetical protein
MAVAVDTQRINLEGECRYECGRFSLELYMQLASGHYEECSVQRIVPVHDWMAAQRTARKRAARATRFGYEFIRVARHEFADDIHAINTSTAERQGRPMSAGYAAMPPRLPDPAYPCRRHGVHPYGVIETHGSLVAYLWCYRSGELALVSQILGHADHLRNDVMYLLFQGAMEQESRIGDGFWVYNRHDSGTDGLRYFKEKLGFRAQEVEWRL